MYAIRFPIETARLTIRPFVPEDAAELFALWADPANERYRLHAPDYPPPASVDEVRRTLEEAQADPLAMTWAVRERETGALVGDCGLFRAEGEIELAYGFGRRWWGRGYATEAARACVEAGFEQLGAERIVADVPTWNRASIRVLEKLGFRLEREEGGKRYYALTRSSAPAPPAGGSAGSPA